MARLSLKAVATAAAPLAMAAMIALGVGVVAGTTPAAAQSIPNKTCTDNRDPSGIAQPGDTITCLVMSAGILVNGEAVSVQPMAPSGATIPSNGCTGVTGAGTAPFTYSTAATLANGECTFTVTATTFGTAGNSVIGTELLKIPGSTPAGTSVTQQAKECGPPLNGNPPICGPFLPMGTSGAGSCVGGTALPVIGGCTPAPPTATPTSSATSSSTPTATPTRSGTGSDTPSPPRAG